MQLHAFKDSSVKGDFDDHFIMALRCVEPGRSDFHRAAHTHGRNGVGSLVSPAKGHIESKDLQHALQSSFGAVIQAIRLSSDTSSVHESYKKILCVQCDYSYMHTLSI